MPKKQDRNPKEERIRLYIIGFLSVAFAMLISSLDSCG